MSFPSINVEGPRNELNWGYLGSYLIIGKGNPQGAVKGRIGAVFLREDGAPGKTVYVKSEGNGTESGWEAIEGSKGGGFATVKEVVEEAEKRAAADAVLSGKISAEEAARKSADSSEKAIREEQYTSLLQYIEQRILEEETERLGEDELRVKGPGSAVDGDIAVYSGTTGKLVKDSGKTIAKVLLEAEEVARALAAAAAAGFSIKNPVSYATTAALTVSAETEKTLEGSAPLTVDGKTPPPVGARILVKSQASEKQNGIYTVTKDEAFGGEGTFGGEGFFGEGSKWQLTRAVDADSTEEVKQGMFVLVTLGTTNASTTWILTTENPIVIGTTSQTFAAFTAQPIGPAGGDLTGTYPNPTIGEGKVNSAKIENGAIVNADVNATAEIAYSKLNLANSVKGSDIAAETIEGSDLNANAKNLFAQLPETAARKVLWGRVSSAGTKEGGSEGWTVERPATGEYKLKFSPELGSVATVLPVPSGAGQQWQKVISNGKAEAVVKFFNSSFGPENTSFHFNVYG